MRPTRHATTTCGRLALVCALFGGSAAAADVTGATQAPAPQNPPNPLGALAREHDEYPPVRNLALVHFFSIEGDVKTEPLRKGIADLGTAEVEARIVYGPENTSSRPGRWFLAIEAPAAVKSSDVAKVLKRAASSVDVLAWTSFNGPAAPGTAGASGAFGMSPREWALGISNDLRWADTFLGRYQFYSVPGRLDAATIKDRLKKAVEAFAPGQGDVGTLVRDGFTWQITSALDAAQAKKLDKALEKLDGVVLARTDVAAKTLMVHFDLDGQRVSAPPRAKANDANGTTTSSSSSSGAQTGEPVRARFDVNPILDLLAKEKVTVATIEKRETAPGGDAGGEPPSKHSAGG